MHVSPRPTREANGLDSAALYRRDLERFPPLPKEQEREVAQALWAARREAWVALLASPGPAHCEVALRTVAPQTCGAKSRSRRPKAKPRLRGDLVAALLSSPEWAALQRVVAREQSPGASWATALPKLRSADPYDAALGLAVAGLPQSHPAALALRRLGFYADRLYSHNLRLVPAVAQEFAGKAAFLGVATGDVVAWGNLGLHQAVRRFDPGRGLRFSTYGTWWIRHAIGRGLDDAGRLVRLPVHANESIVRLHRAGAADESPPPLADLAAATGLRPARVSELLGLAARPVSLDAPAFKSGSRDEDKTVADVTPDEDAACEDALIRKLDGEIVARRYLETLTEQEWTVLVERHGLCSPDGEGKTLEETAVSVPVTNCHNAGRTTGLTRERTRQIEQSGLARLRRAIEAPAPPRRDAVVGLSPAQVASALQTFNARRAALAGHSAVSVVAG